MRVLNYKRTHPFDPNEDSPEKSQLGHPHVLTQSVAGRTREAPIITLDRRLQIIP